MGRATVGALEPPGVCMSSTVVTRWSRPQDASFTFPEQHLPLIQRTDATGVCFSGGGTRAQCAAVGQLRALSMLGLLADVRYISSVSGGSWGTAPFLWGDPGRRDEDLLGPHTRPEDITMDALEAPIPTTCILSTATTNLDAAMGDQRAVDTPTDRIWTEAVGAVYLAPFDLHNPQSPAFLTGSTKERDTIVARNPALADHPFLCARAPERLPYHVINSCILGPAELEPFTDESPLSFETTPLYGGNPQRREQLYFSKDGRWQEARLGGGYVESFALGSSQLVSIDGANLVTVAAPTRPFTLADAVGTSSAAFAGVTASISGLLRGLGSLTPTYTGWSLEADAPSHHMAMGDGGVLENYGLLTLLRRQVQRVVVFINTSTALDLDYDPEACVPDTDQVDSFLPALFGFRHSSFGTALQNNQVFAGADWAPLVRALQAARRDGRPVVHHTRHTVLENLVWGIDGGYEVEVLWCYLERVPQWEDRLPDDVGAAVDRGHRLFFKGELARFPHYKTAGQDSLADVHLSPEQARLLADFTCETVQMDATIFADLLRRRT